MFPEALAQDRPQLGAEHRQMAKRQPNAPQAERRVALVFRIGQVRDLVGAQVERADGDRSRRHRLRDLFVGLEMIFFLGFAIAAEIEELRAIQPDPVRSALDAVGNLVRKLDVAQQFDPHAVSSDRRQLAKLLEPDRLTAKLLGLMAVLGERVRVGAEDHRPLVAVDDD